MVGRIFRYSPNSASTSYNKPVLIAGETVRVRDSVLSTSIVLLNEVGTPFVGVYGLYSTEKV